MPEPVSASAGAIFSITKAWSIIAGVCGSVIPILALSEEHKTSFKNAVFMAVTGSSFAIFVGPWVGEYLHLTSLEAIVALSWGMGAIGVYVIRAVLRWLDKKGEMAIEKLVGKLTGNQTSQTVDVNINVSNEPKP